MADGVITLSRTELVQTLKLSKGQSQATGSVDIIPSTFSFLKNLSQSFDRLQWVNLLVYWKPAVGTTYGGLVTYGMDWDFATNDVNREKISGFTPSMTMAVWTDTERKPMVLPTSRLQSREWYLPNAAVQDIDKGPGKLHYAASGTVSQNDTTLGELWVRYTVRMQGTNPA